MFVEEFCRFARIETAIVGDLRVSSRSRNPVGFMTTIDKSTISDELRWGVRVFNTPRVALIGPMLDQCGSLLFFDPQTGVLDAIEGFVHGDTWPQIEEPSYWSEGDRITGRIG
jgi:hypothetical protein